MDFHRLMFANGSWGDNIRVPGTPSTGGGGPSVDLTPVLNRLAAVEATNLQQGVMLDDLGLALNDLRGQIQGSGSADDPGLRPTLDFLQGEMVLLQGSLHGFIDQQEATNNELIFLAAGANNTATTNSSRIDAVVLTNNEQTQALQYIYEYARDAHYLIQEYHPIIGDLQTDQICSPLDISPPPPPLRVTERVTKN